MSLLAVLCLPASFSLQAAEDEAQIVRKTGRLEVEVDDEDNVTSATLICQTENEWDDEVKFTLVLNAKTKKQAAELKDKKVLVIGVLKVNEDEILDSIRVSSITEAKEKAAEPAKPAKPEGEDKNEGDLF
jgi:hypothetical protein